MHTRVPYLKHGSLIVGVLLVMVSVVILPYGISAEQFHSKDPPATTWGWDFEGSLKGDQLGRCWRPAGDINDDGYDDLIIGAQYEDTNGANAGAAYLFLGSPDGFDPDTPDWTDYGENPIDFFGFSLDGVGDVNGDGFDDVLIGAYAHDINHSSSTTTQEGKIYLYYGGETGLASSPSWSLLGPKVGGMFGYVVAAAGDVDGDGYDDFAVASPLFDNPDTDEGMVWVFYGSSSGPQATAWIGESNQNGAYFGYSINGLGDVNADGYDDLIVGANYYNSLKGAIFVWYGSANGLNSGVSGDPSNADWKAVNTIETGFGIYSGSPGDVNDDGYDDVIASDLHYPSSSDRKGTVFLWYGSAAGVNHGVDGSLSAPDWKAASDIAGTMFGTLIGKPADINGDGFADVVVGCRSPGDYSTGFGSVLAYYGSSSGLGVTGDLSNYDWKVIAPGMNSTSEFYDSEFAHQAGSVGDANGDGIDDVVVGAHYWKNYSGIDTDDPDYRTGKIMAYYSSNSSSVVKGRVLYGIDSVGGHAVSVSAYSQNSSTSTLSRSAFLRDQTLSDEDFVLNDLAPGMYYIRAFADMNNSGGSEPDTGDFVSWYDKNDDGVPDLVDLTMDSLAAGIDIEIVPASPYITSSDSTTFATDAANHFTFAAAGNPLPGISYSGSLPAGVAFQDNGDGTATLSGSPPDGSEGDYPLTLTAANGVAPDAEQSFTLVVDNEVTSEPPKFTSSDSTSFMTKTENSFLITTTGSPLPSISYSGDLPDGVEFQDNGDGTATLSGSPPEGSEGDYSLTLTAANGDAPDAEQSFTLTVNSDSTSKFIYLPLVIK